MFECGGESFESATERSIAARYFSGISRAAVQGAAPHPLHGGAAADRGRRVRGRRRAAVISILRRVERRTAANSVAFDSVRFVARHSIGRRKDFPTYGDFVKYAVLH